VYYDESLVKYNASLRDKFVRFNPLDFTDVTFLALDGKIYGGIVEDVSEYLDQPLPYKIDTTYDKSNLFVFTHRPHQHEAVTKLLEYYRGIIQASPGVGKTVMIADICARLNTKCIVISENKKPFTQIYNTLVEACPGLNVGRVGDGYNETECDVIVAMRQTIVHDKYTEFLSKFKVVIVDECHHGVTKQYTDIYVRCVEAEKLYGVSATPYRDDEFNDMITPIFGRVRYKIDYGEAIDNDMLCPVVVITKKMKKMEIEEPVYTKPVFTIDPFSGETIQSEEPLQPWMIRRLKATFFQKIYNDYIIYNDDRNKDIIEYANKLNSKGKTCVIIVSRVEHANELHRLMPSAQVLYSSTKKKDKERIFADLESKKIKTVISTLFDEAVDVKSLDGVAIASAGKSTVKIIQRIRSTRKFEGYINGVKVVKEVGYVFYPLDQTGCFASQSRQCLRMLKAEVAKSPLNKIHYL
jgi:superfamily II DNA or RNA helicase